MSVKIEKYTVPAANLGPENPLPLFRSKKHDIDFDADKLNIPEEERVGLGWESSNRVLPYRIQDGYDRARDKRDFFSLVLENDFIRATVLPEIGGIVASIEWKPLDNKELIYKNPVFQPCNLALRDAWVSGGIEFNTAHLGHHYLTCSPIHAAIVKDDEGNDFVRLFAWDRVKCFPYQVDIHLPGDSKFLFIHVKLINPHDYVMPMYWWTNIGMVEYPGGRVIAPCDSTYNQKLEVTDCPIINGIDYSYVTNIVNAYDLFFRLPKEQRKWEVLVDKEGEGLLHIATPRLKATKLFAWGMNRGSRRWNDYLSTENAVPFQEIQFGLTHTQMHSIPMPANTEWEWTEAISYFDGEAKTLHSEWKDAYTYADGIVENMLPISEMDKYDKLFIDAANKVPEEVVFKGLGWGALENIRREKVGEEINIPNYMPFDVSDLSNDQSNWLELLNTGVFAERDVNSDPGQYMIQEDWMKLLEDSINSGKSNNWFAWYHLGVMKREHHFDDEAIKCFNKSLECKENGWAYYALSTMRMVEEDFEGAKDLMLKAWNAGLKNHYIAPKVISLYYKLGKYEDAKAFYMSLPEDVKDAERVALEWGRCAVRLYLFDEVEEVIKKEFRNICEGELSIVDLWFEMYARKKALADNVEYTDELLQKVKNEVEPPEEIDLRMFVPGSDEYIPPTQK